MEKTNKKPESAAMHGTLVQVAHLYYDEGLSQQQIADQLDVSRSLIAQYLIRAREEGIVRIQIMDPSHTCTGLADVVKKKTGVKSVTVIPNPHGSSSLTLRALASAAGDFITNNLKEGDTLGMAWGRTTSAVVDMLKPAPVINVEIVPLMGECGQAGMHSQMSRLVMLAAERLKATPYFLSLPMVLSTATLRGALIKESAVGDVIERWNYVDFACVGIGVVPPVPGMVVYIGEEKIPELVKAGAVGDICGIYYDRDGNIIPSGLEQRIIRISVEQLQNMSTVTAVACGEEKAGAVLGALRTGLVTDLFIDQALAEHIQSRMKSPHTGDTR